MVPIRRKLRESSETFPQPDSVTSNLAVNKKKADHGQGVSGRNTIREKATKLFVVKILTSKALWLKILQTIFAKPAPVKAFRAGGGGGYPQTGTTQKERVASEAGIHQ